MSRSDIGKGGALLAGAKLYFLIAAYATTLALTHIIDPAMLGRYNVVARLIAIPNMVIIQTLMFAVSRPMAAQFDEGTPAYFALRAKGFKIAAVLGGVVSLAFFAGAGGLADWLNDDSLTLAIRAVAPISAAYAFYAINIGTLNATRRFSRQAMLDVIMATSKGSLIVVAAAMGLGLAAVCGGFTIAAVVALLISVGVVLRNRPESADRSMDKAPAMAEFAGVLIFFTLATNALLSTDLFVLKRYAVGEAAAEAVGFYSSAQLVALVPYSLLNAVSLTMFPLIATLSASGDSEKVKRYVTETAKVTVLLLALMAAVASGAAAQVQGLLFPSAYGSAAGDLQWMVWGYSGYSLAVTSAWILNSSGRSRVAIGLVVLVLIAVAGFSMAWVPGLGHVGAARSVAIAGGVGGAGALAALAWAFKARLPLGFSIKLLLAIAATAGVGMSWQPEGKVLALAKLTALTLTFLGVVFASRAITIEQIKALRRAG